MRKILDIFTILHIIHHWIANFGCFHEMESYPLTFEELIGIIGKNFKSKNIPITERTVRDNATRNHCY